MQSVTQGIASRRSRWIGLPQFSQMPKVPSSIRLRAASRCARCSASAPSSVESSSRSYVYVAMSARWLSRPPASSRCSSSVVPRFSSCRYEIAFSVRSRSSRRRVFKESTSIVLMRALPLSGPLLGDARSRRARFPPARRACRERRVPRPSRSYALARRGSPRAAARRRRSRARPPAARRRGPSRPRRAGRRARSFAHPARPGEQDESSRQESSPGLRGFRSGIGVAEDIQGALELSADARGAPRQPFALGTGRPEDLARRRMRFLDDDRRLLLCSVTQLRGRPLGGNERLAEQRLQVAVADDVLLELLDAVDQVGALAPDLLEAVRNLEQQPFGVSTPVTAHRSAVQLDVPDLDGRDSHYPSLSRTELTILAPRMSAKTPTIGDRSSGPNGGRKRRKTRRYGSQTSYRNRWILFSVGEYGSRTQLVRM